MEGRELKLPSDAVLVCGVRAVILKATRNAGKDSSSLAFRSSYSCQASLLSTRFSGTVARWLRSNYHDGGLRAREMK